MSFRVLERRVKALVIRILGKLLASHGVRAPPDWASRPHRVLYLRYDRIGDMVLATGIMKAIVATHPGITVDVLASRGNAAVLRGTPYVANVWTIDRSRPWTYLSAIARMRRMRYDAVIDAMVMAPSLTTMMLMWASGARHRIGVGDRGNEFALTLPVPRSPGAVHYVDHSAAVLQAFGVTVGPPDGRAVPRTVGDRSSDVPTDWGRWRPEVFLTRAEWSEAEARWGASAAATADGSASWRLLVNVSAGAEWRYWPDASFIATLARIRVRFPALQVMVVGAPADRDRMRRIAESARVSLAETPDYRQMMALVATADFAFTADTSVAHVASAFDKPALVMFGRGRSGLYGPYGTTGQSISTPGLSLDALEPDAVIAALESLIERAILDPDLCRRRSFDAHPRRGVGAGASGAPVQR